MASTGQKPDFERLFWAVFEATRNPMVFLDDERLYRQGNAAALEFLGLPHDELLTIRLEDLVPPEDRDDLLERWRRFLSDGHAWGHTILRLPRGGDVGVDYCATAHVVPDKNLAVFMPDGDERVEMEHDAPAEGHTNGADKLTPRELEVIREVARGGSSAQIGERLFISSGTVRTHVRNAMEKRGARTRAHLVALALSDGLIEL